MPKILMPSQIKDVLNRAALEKWSYPQIFEALQAAGVEYYETHVSTCQTTYYGGDESLKESSLSQSPLVVAPDFSVESIQNAIGRNQRKETTYLEFLQEIAAAGVFTYRVDMKLRSICYKGREGEKYIEKVPPFENLSIKVFL